MNWLSRLFDAITTWWWEVGNGPYVDSSPPPPDDSRMPSTFPCPDTQWIDDADRVP